MKHKWYILKSEKFTPKEIEEIKKGFQFISRKEVSFDLVFDTRPDLYSQPQASIKEIGKLTPQGYDGIFFYLSSKDRKKLTKGLPLGLKGQSNTLEGKRVIWGHWKTNFEKSLFKSRMIGQLVNETDLANGTFHELLHIYVKEFGYPREMAHYLLYGFDKLYTSIEEDKGIARRGVMKRDPLLLWKALPLTLEDSNEILTLERDLKRGDQGEDVVLAQRLLNQKLKVNIKEDGIYGEVTENAVKVFQCKAKIICSNPSKGFGRIGTKTRTALLSDKTVTDLLPLVERKLQQLLSIAKKCGINIGVTSTYRSYDEQQKLYDQGRKTPGNIVTNAKPGESFHNHRVAFDIHFIDKNGNPTWVGDWETLGMIGEAIGFTWGKSFGDKPHFQMDIVPTGYKKYNFSDFQKGSVKLELYE